MVPPPAKKAKPDDKKTTKEKPKTDKAAAGSTTYNRLYFDLNHNGDLTDDKPIEVETAQDAHGVGVVLSVSPRRCRDRRRGNQARLFLLPAGQQLASPDFHYVTLSLNAAVYREGDITLEERSTTSS